MRQSGEGFQKTGYKFRLKLFSGMISQACQVEGKRKQDARNGNRETVASLPSWGSVHHEECRGTVP